jgi:hypothetical protein
MQAYSGSCQLLEVSDEVSLQCTDPVWNGCITRVHIFTLHARLDSANVHVVLPDIDSQQAPTQCLYSMPGPEHLPHSKLFMPAL